MIISWVTVDEPGSSKVVFWSENSKEKRHAKGKVTTYKYYNYKSGFIHHTTIRNLKVSKNFHINVSYDCSKVVPLFLFCFYMRLMDDMGMYDICIKIMLCI